jgi:hypothetical protein
MGKEIFPVSNLVLLSLGIFAITSYSMLTGDVGKFGIFAIAAALLIATYFAIRNEGLFPYTKGVLKVVRHDSLLATSLFVAAFILEKQSVLNISNVISPDVVVLVASLGIFASIVDLVKN